MVPEFTLLVGFDVGDILLWQGWRCTMWCHYLVTAKYPSKSRW